jgi:predicted RNA-binding Zn-ribbon protein involved in translation (DUF1610 family)
MSDTKFNVYCLDCTAETEILVVDNEDEAEPFVCPMCGSESIKVKEIDDE